MYKKLILYLVIAFLLIVILDRVIFKLVYIPETQDTYTSFPAIQLLNRPVPSDIWAIGASHIGFGLDTDEFEKSSGLTLLNAQAPGRSYESNVYFTYELLGKIRKPKLILLDVAWMAFQVNPEIKVHAVDFQHISLKNKLRYLMFHFPSSLKYLSKLYSYRYNTVFYKSKEKAIKEAIADKKFDIYTERGFVRSSRVMDTDVLRKSLDRFDREYNKGKYTEDKAKIDAFIKIIEIARKEDIPVVIIELPEYYKLKEKQQREEYDKRLEIIKKKYNVEYLNFNISDNPITREMKYFRDADHLNGVGAREWTREFCKTLRKKGIIKE